MPTPSVGASSDATLTVPAVCADSFRAEVLDNLKCASQNLVEGAEWFLEREDLNRLDQEDRPNLATAERLLDAIRDQRGDVMVSDSPELLASAVRSAVRALGADLDQALLDGGVSTDEIRALLAPLAVWCDVIDAHDWLAARYVASDTVQDGGSQ
jgi:hypothetical protein